MKKDFLKCSLIQTVYSHSQCDKIEEVEAELFHGTRYTEPPGVWRCGEQA